MTYSISYKHSVEFYETDMAGIVHFSNYFRWMESAETALFKALGLPIAKKDGAIITGWPKIHTSCTFTAPLRFQDEIEVELSVVKISNSALSYSFQFYKIEENKKTKVANGEMTTVYAKFDILGGSMTASLIEDQLRNKLQSFGEDDS